jgi:hypothetical protein
MWHSHLRGFMTSFLVAVCPFWGVARAPGALMTIPGLLLLPWLDILLLLMPGVEATACLSTACCVATEPRHRRAC